jgi:hypothetical protein
MGMRYYTRMMVNRKRTYRRYPTATQAAALLHIKKARQGLDNVALAQRHLAWKQQ